MCAVRDDRVELPERAEPSRPSRPDFRGNRKHTTPSYAWTDLTYLLHKDHVSWGYYVVEGTSPTARTSSVTCKPPQQDARRPASGTRCRTSTTVRGRPARRTSSRCSSFFAAARTGTLPAVSWVAPTTRQRASAGLVSAGQAYVTSW